MTIETAFDVGQRVKAEVDGGKAEGIVKAIVTRTDADGSRINYEVHAKWEYNDGRQTMKYDKPQIYTEAELVKLQGNSKVSNR